MFILTDKDGRKLGAESQEARAWILDNYCILEEVRVLWHFAILMVDEVIEVV